MGTVSPQVGFEPGNLAYRATTLTVEPFRLTYYGKLCLLSQPFIHQQHHHRLIYVILQLYIRLILGHSVILLIVV